MDRTIDGNVNAVRYVLKYVNKTIRSNDRIYAALLFASNKSMFSMSQNPEAMLDIRRARQDAEWSFVGTCHENDLRLFCREQRIEYGDFVKVEVILELMHEYQDLFDVWDDG